MAAWRQAMLWSSDVSGGVQHEQVVELRDRSPSSPTWHKSVVMENYISFICQLETEYPIRKTKEEEDKSLGLLRNMAGRPSLAGSFTHNWASGPAANR